MSRSSLQTFAPGMTTEWSLVLNDDHGPRVDFTDLVHSNSVESLRKRCIKCGYVDKSEGRMHKKCTSMEMLPETKYVVLKIERFVTELKKRRGVDVWEKREVLGAITGFNVDDVNIMGKRLRVCAAVVYHIETGEGGHYYTYVRQQGEN